MKAAICRFIKQALWIWFFLAIEIILASFLYAYLILIDVPENASLIIALVFGTVVYGFGVLYMKEKGSL